MMGTASFGSAPRRALPLLLRTRRSAPGLVHHLLVLMIVVWTLAPVAWLFISSISTHNELLSVPVHWIPQRPTFENYAGMFDPATMTGDRFLHSLRNSLLIASTVTLFSLVVGTLTAYALARLRFRGRTALVLSLLAIRMIPVVALVIPFFVIVIRLEALVPIFYDRWWTLAILYNAFILGFVIWVMRGYFLTIPVELEEAARIDGCTRVGALVRVVLPLSAPGLVATGILAFLLAWDEFLLALIFSKTTAAITLPLYITQLGSQYITAYESIAAAGVAAAIPPVALALLFQRFIVRGLTSGGVKG